MYDATKPCLGKRFIPNTRQTSEFNVREQKRFATEFQILYCKWPLRNYHLQSFSVIAKEEYLQLSENATSYSSLSNYVFLRGRYFNQNSRWLQTEYRSGDENPACLKPDINDTCKMALFPLFSWKTDFFKKMLAYNV